MAFSVSDAVLVPVDEVDIPYRASQKAAAAQNEGFAGTKERTTNMGICIKNRSGVAGELGVIQPHQEVQMLGAGIAVIHTVSGFSGDDSVQNPVQIHLKVFVSVEIPVVDKFFKDHRPSSMGRLYDTHTVLNAALLHDFTHLVRHIVIGRAPAYGLYGNGVLINLHISCNHSILQAPLYVHNTALRDLFMQEPDVITHFRHVQALDMAFVGIGTTSNKDSIAFRGNYIAENEAKKLSEQGFVCDICGHQLQADGSEPPNFLSDRVVGISLEQLHQIPIVVGLCTGHKKAVPLLAALRGNHINSLIADEVCAIALLSLEKEA